MGEVTESDVAEGLVSIGDPLPDTQVVVRDAELRQGIPRGIKLMTEPSSLTSECCCSVKHGHGALWIGGSKRICLLEGETEGLRYVSLAPLLLCLTDGILAACAIREIWPSLKVDVSCTWDARTTSSRCTASD
jgi:hypothetical protein